MSAPSPYVELVELAHGRPNKAPTLTSHVHVLARRCRTEQPDDHAQAVLLNMMTRPSFWVDAIADRSPHAARVVAGSREPEDVEAADRVFDAYVMTVLKNRVLSEHGTDKRRGAALLKHLLESEARGLVVEPGPGRGPKDVGAQPDTEAETEQIFRQGMLVLRDVAEEIHASSPQATFDARDLLREIVESALSPGSLLERVRREHPDPAAAKTAYDACTKRHSRLRGELAKRLEQRIADGVIGAEAGSRAELLLKKFLNRRPNVGGSSV
ncbi:MAG: hypothetical protein H6716_24075 [Polyangiaceae bacterium]|nr:hypothetical protein [Polyangiaceae bacterium]